MARFQFTLRRLFFWITWGCCLLGICLYLIRAQREALVEARRAAIKDGRIPPEVIDGVLVKPEGP